MSSTSTVELQQALDRLAQSEIRWTTFTWYGRGALFHLKGSTSDGFSVELEYHSSELYLTVSDPPTLIKAFDFRIHGNHPKNRDYRPDGFRPDRKTFERAYELLASFCEREHAMYTALQEERRLMRAKQEAEVRKRFFD